MSFFIPFLLAIYLHDIATTRSLIRRLCILHYVADVLLIASSINELPYKGCLKYCQRELEWLNMRISVNKWSK